MRRVLPQRFEGVWRGALLAALGLLLLLPAAASAGELYVADSANHHVSVVDIPSGKLVGPGIEVGNSPSAIAISPDGRRAYVANEQANSVSVIDTKTKAVEPKTIEVGLHPDSIAISPDGSRAYVTNSGSDSVSVIDLATETVEPKTIKVGKQPRGIAVAADGKRVYVVDQDSHAVSVIDAASEEVVKEIEVGESPTAIAITPDGRHAFVPSGITSTLAIIDTQSETATEIPTGTPGSDVAVAPSGANAYVVNDATGNGAFSRIDVAAGKEDDTFELEHGAENLAIASDGSRAYLSGFVGIQVINLATDKLEGEPIEVGALPEGIAIVPDQPPVAAFSVSAPRVRPGVPVNLDAGRSKDPDGAIAIYAWSFGDRQAATAKAPATTHTFARPGTYKVGLNLTDNEGCSTKLVFTGRTASCNGLPRAALTKTIKVAYPGVRLRCPKSAGRAGCSFKLGVLAGKRTSARGHLKLKAGHSGIASLVPKPAFKAKIARAKRVRVRLTQRIGSAKTVRTKKLRVVR